MLSNWTEEDLAKWDTRLAGDDVREPCGDEDDEYTAHYREGIGWDVYDAAGEPIGTMPEAAVELDVDEDGDPIDFDPNIYPWEDSPHFVRVDADGDVIPNG